MGDNRTEPGGMRFYDKKDIIRLKFILKLKDLGITLNDMKGIAVNYELNNQATDKILPQLIDILDVQLKGIDEKIDNLIGLRKEITDYRQRIIVLLQQAGNDELRAANEYPVFKQEQSRG